MKHNRCLLVLLVASLASSVLAMAADVAGTPAAAAAGAPVSNCKPSAVSATTAHQQLMALSSMIDPSGKLSKIINEYHPESVAGHSHKHEGDPMQVAASEEEPVKRSAMDDEQAAASNKTSTTTTESSSANATLAKAQDVIKALVVSAINNAANTTAAPVLAKSEPAVNVTVTPAPNVTETSTAANVTVNVFLQLAPDSKTDELVS